MNTNHVPKETGRFFKIGQLYKELNDRQKGIVRDEYNRRFGLSTAQFYADLQGRVNINPSKLIFFSRIFGVPIEALFADLPEGPEPVADFSNHEALAV